MTKFAVIVKRNSVHGYICCVYWMYCFYILHFVISEMENFTVFNGTCNNITLSQDSICAQIFCTL